MEETISLQDIFSTLKRRLKLLIIIPLIALVISGLVSYFLLTPIYESSTQILVTQTTNENITQQDIRTNIEVINTYNDIIKSPAILDLVVAELNLDMSTSSLNSLISVSSQNNSQVVTLSVEHENPAAAANIANTTALVFQEKIVDLMNVDNVNVLSPAVVSDSPSPIKPNPTLNMAIALVVGLMAAVGLAFLLEYLDPTIKSEEELEKLLGLPLLGVVPNMDAELQGKQKS
ncbi:capsular polysaccharide biosynthesis protein [Alkalihalobacillus alcalophilus ATCC 27647 = CGMCC 1.3604]|uniref:Capsular biosynthesis protein n=1 Tax=Alkalihalobacillus alcalophilus ATCC 27647 = CGMCC 1.3604 TaxID=1218173 RepID=A0A094WIM7_ALKAL|nr:Wzz/FepE/Etk N-terminal domain-containing protein [Alkalihalobacillus alcalophilus]KGA95768.1 capsular biosynthesis protein [Alkalihalobacillus alcalophilus ATCC 27647 = CGMCC 1.3604]MED1563830.1 Wzz/FepE/Etk N-terminal domain-containing protein [Alkalihalobacillus alcalophilus]THG92050.1 capsular polysaccharide biosynthesis protein [Alkalihalobacillus alcalophilus ATCC 27647 = CGMCC 1.3604]